jgi:phage-related protein
MTIGFIYDGGVGYATPDKTLGRQVSPKVLVAKFGDGYEQRIADGINSIKETYSLSFRQREKAFIDDVVQFLDSQKGVTKFSLNIPDSNVTPSGEREIKVVSENYNVVYDYDNFYSLTVQLRRVYEA